jgi:four helix bundle protein
LWCWKNCWFSFIIQNYLVNFAIDYVFDKKQFIKLKHCIMKDSKFSFEKLAVWQESRTLVSDIYQLVRKFTNEEKYALGDQVRRAIVSVPSNIAEGTGRGSLKEQIHFVEIAYGSLMETYCQLQVASDLGFIQETDIATVKPKIFSISNMLIGLRASLRKRLNL